MIGDIMLNIVICDDNQDHLKDLKQLTNGSIDNVNITLFNSGHDLIDYYENNLHRIDIIVCDIELDNLCGINVAKILKKLNSNVQIIFVSAHIRYFEEVYCVDHVYFLSKPIDRNKFSAAIQKAATKAIENKNKYITITTKSALHIINLNEIKFIEADLRKIKIHAEDSVYTKYAKLDDFLELLDSRFLICHKSFAVNMEKVVKVNRNSFVLKGKVEIPISRSRYASVKRKFIDYIGDS